MIQLTKHKKQLLEENRSLRRKNVSAYSCLIGLASLSLCSIVSCSKNSADLEKAQQENNSLRVNVKRFKEESANLLFKNQSLMHYANDAHIFANSIQVPSPDLVDGKTEIEEKIIQKEYEKAKKQYDGACKVLEINQATLSRLQKGWEK